MNAPETTTRDRLLERFAALGPTQQAAARFVVDHPNEVVTVSMRTLAARVQVPPAALVRLAQAVGYAGWRELKAAVVGELGLGDGRYAQRARRLVARRRQADLAHEIFASHLGNLQATEAESAAALGAAARLLARARAVHVAGFRASLTVAHAFFYGYRLLRDEVHLIDGAAAGLEAQLRPLGRRDVVVAVGFAPYSRESAQVLAHAQAAGAAVLAVTDSRASPLARAARQTLLFAAASPSFFPSVAAAVALVEALLEQLAADGGVPAVQRIGRVEKQLRAAGAYLPETGLPVKRPGRIMQG